MKAFYFADNSGTLRTAEVLFVTPKDGKFYGPLVELCNTSDAPGYWQGFDYYNLGAGQLVAPDTLVIHKISKYNFRGSLRTMPHRRFVGIEYKSGYRILAEPYGKKKDSALDFFKKSVRSYIPRIKSPLIRYRSPVFDSTAPLGWEI